MLVRPPAPARPGLSLRPGRINSANDELDTYVIGRLGPSKPLTLVPSSQAIASARIRLALVGGYTPRRCGIATFTADTYASLVAGRDNLVVDVYALTRANDSVPAKSPVCGTICDSDPASYIEAAARIEQSGADTVWLQHEFGLFGGPAGNMILELVDRIAVPLVITLHTVLADPDPAQMAVMQRLVARASKLVVMSEQARLLLARVYGAGDQQVVLIPHGAPDRPFGRSDEFKEKFGFVGRKILATFGLLSPGKGIEAVISALPAIVAAHPEALYCIIGATHPNLLARDGEAYRERLQALARSYGVEEHIHWVDAFLDTGELLDLIEAADIFVTPYPGAAQSTSGTLSYAVALGKAVVSTPYSHAAELLADDHGVLVPFNSREAIAQEVNALLESPERLQRLQKRAYARGREMIWPEFASRCMAVLNDVQVSVPIRSRPAMPGLSGLLRICDDTGILQHSIYGVPDRAHGYCVDDNARALMLMNRLGEEAEPHRSRMAMIFAAFVQSAWNPDRSEFRNFMGFKRDWLEEVGSEDSCGRTLWALGAAVKDSPLLSLRHWARDLFDISGLSAIDFRSPRATAFAMLGADYLLETAPSHELATTILGAGADRLMSLFEAVDQPDWRWFETRLAYDNSRLCEAMIRAGLRLGRDDYMRCGLTTLEWLMALQTAPAGHFRPIGSDSFSNDFAGPQPFDQQPVEIWAAMDACLAAFDATSEPGWRDEASRAFEWFSGRNDRGVIVGDVESGTCHDGINPRGLNLNQGAESVLAYQLAHCTLQRIGHA